jgi:DNA-binding NarL/FixJ family response regulator
MTTTSAARAPRDLGRSEQPVDLTADAFRAGASGYLLKRSAASELSTVIHEVMEGPIDITRSSSRSCRHHAAVAAQLAGALMRRAASGRQTI